MTLEYGYYLRYIASMPLSISYVSLFISEYPGFSFIRPDEFRARFLDGTLDTFDAIFSYSSIEHFGLGEFWYKEEEDEQSLAACYEIYL